MDYLFHSQCEGIIKRVRVQGSSSTFPSGGKCLKLQKKSLVRNLPVTMLQKFFISDVGFYIQYPTALLGLTRFPVRHTR